MFPTPIQKASPFAQTAYKILLPVALFLWLLPLIGVAITSVRPAGDLAAGNYFGIPSGFAGFENYSAVFNNSPIGYYILNSFKVTIPTVIGAVALSCLTGFALAVYKFKGLPFALIESARVEGVSEWRIFRYIVLPLMRPAIAALSVLIFTFVWNDYFWATVLVQGQHAMPVTAGLYSLNGQWVAAWHLVSAGSIVAALPPVAMFFLMQRHFIAGLTLGATKG